MPLSARAMELRSMGLVGSAEHGEPWGSPGARARIGDRPRSSLGAVYTSPAHWLRGSVASIHTAAVTEDLPRQLAPGGGCNEMRVFTARKRSLAIRGRTVDPERARWHLALRPHRNAATSGMWSLASSQSRGAPTSRPSARSASGAEANT
jgi:hypothetical protein